MIQLQSRIIPFIGETITALHQWKVDDEATIVTRSMREDVRHSGTHAGERELRIVNTACCPHLALSTGSNMTIKDVLAEVLKLHEKEFQYLDRGIGTGTPKGRLLLQARAMVLE